MMKWKVCTAALTCAAALFLSAPGACAQQQAYGFYVLSQRSVALTGQYWNPILIYVSKRSGVPLELKLAKNVKEGNALAEQGAYEFLFTNHFFTPDRDKLGYRVIARPIGRGIRGQIVVPYDSALKTLQELKGKEVAFPTSEAFAAYWLPMDALLKAKVNVKQVFTSNQEASIAQLKVGAVAAAAVNDTIIERYARREGFEYRLLWNSEIYNDLCIMASPKLPRDKVDAVQAAFVGMVKDPEGLKVLKAGAELLKINERNVGFIASDNRDYENYRAFYKHTAVKQNN